MMEYTTITIRDSFSAMNPAALVVRHGKEVIALDGLDADALRRVARLLNRAAEHIEDHGPNSNTHGPGSFSMGCNFEWDQFTAPWPADRVDEA